ncbi:hypothetical protein ACFQWF_02355 [Methylorubrum suomiense]
MQPGTEDNDHEDAGDHDGHPAAAERCPALAMSCCGGGKGKGAMMCGKGGMAMNMKGKKGGCCCEGMKTNMSKRA